MKDAKVVRGKMSHGITYLFVEYLFARKDFNYHFGANNLTAEEEKRLVKLGDEIVALFVKFNKSLK